MATVKTRPWDSAEHLETLEDVVEYLDAAREDGDPRLLEAAFADVMRSPAIAEARRFQSNALALGPSPTARSFWHAGAPSVDEEQRRHVRVFA